MSTLSEVQAKSAPIISRLGNEAVRIGALKLVERCYKRGVGIRITQGLRTIEEQNALYAQGRTVFPGPIVTNARGGQSYHNFSLAIDFVLIKGGYDMKYDGDSDGLADWVEVVTEAKALGFAWGGDWKSFKDNPHFEMTFGLSLADLRAGKRPNQAQVSAALSKMKSLEEREEKEVSAELEKKLEELKVAFESRLKAIEKKVNISGNQTPPEVYHTALKAAKDVEAITTTNDKDLSGIKTIQMLYNIGLFNPAFIAYLKNFKGEGENIK